MKMGEPFGILLGGGPSKPNKVNTIIDAFKDLNLTVSEEQTLQGYIARAKMADRIFSSVGNCKIIPDENNKKLLIIEKKENKENKHMYICHKCSDTTTIANMKELNISEMKKYECIHSKLSEIVFESQKLESKPENIDKNVIDVVKDVKETIALVVLAKKINKAPGIIHVTSRTKRPKCET